MCNNHVANRCKQCLSCFYCSRECQKSDWSSHRLLCKDFSTQPSRPSLNHKRAILFPADRKRPQMIWIRCERKVEDEGQGYQTSYETVDPHPHLGADRPNVGTMRIEHNPIRNRNLGSGMVHWAPRQCGYSVSLKFRDNFLKDGSIINKSILTSTGTSGSPPHTWCGPIIAVREEPFERYNDITLDDFRHIIDYLLSYLTTELRESNDTEDRQAASIHGVKVCCYGELKLHATKPFVSVNVPRAHPTRLTYSEGTISSISNLLGMPLKLWKIPESNAWINPPGWNENMTADSNQNAAFLMMETDPQKSDWGWTPRYWNSDLGNVLAVRLDGEDLTVDDVSMMCQFARLKLQPMFEDALGAGYGLRSKQEVLSFITWGNMVKFRNEMAEGRATKELDWSA